MGVYLRTRFEACSIILISIRQGIVLHPPPPPSPPLPQNEPLESPPRLGLNEKYKNEIFS